MSAASTQPTYQSPAHRRAVMRHIGETLLPAALAFAVLAPLIGLALIRGGTCVAMIGDAVSTSGASAGPALAVIWNALVEAYLASAPAAAITGIWVALLSPFAANTPRYYIGAALVGLLNTYLFVPTPAFIGQLPLALVGAISAFVCARLLQDAVLKRNIARRDHLSRERAERLAKERAKA